VKLLTLPTASPAGLGPKVVVSAQVCIVYLYIVLMTISPVFLIVNLNTFNIHLTSDCLLEMSIHSFYDVRNTVVLLFYFPFHLYMSRYLCVYFVPALY